MISIDTSPPTLGDIHFMRASDDTHNLTGGWPTSKGTTKQFQTESRLETHGYFQGKDHTQAIIVGHQATATTKATGPVGGNSNIDIIANIYDQMKTGGPLLGVRSVEFKATGQMVGKSIPTVRPFDFAAEFVWDPNRFPPGQQNHDSLRISDLTRVVYANDYTSPSTSVDPRSFFYILSNTDGANPIVDFADRGRYWRSKVTQGVSWNDINSTEAVSNATGAFPDDYYEFTVTAKDAAGLTEDETKRVLLDNWPQHVGAKVVQELGGNLVRIEVTGSQFTANSTVKIYQMARDIFTSASIQDGETISSQGILLGTAATDANGNIVPTTFVYEMRPENYLLADYHGGDDIYQPRLDALANVLMEGGGSRLMKAFAQATSDGSTLAADGQGSDVPDTTSQAPSPSWRPVEPIAGGGRAAGVLPPGRVEVGDQPVAVTTVGPVLAVFVGATDPLVRRPADAGEPAPVRPTRVRAEQPPRPDLDATMRPPIGDPAGEPVRLSVPIAAGEDMGPDGIVGDEGVIPDR